MPSKTVLSYTLMRETRIPRTLSSIKFQPETLRKKNSSILLVSKVSCGLASRASMARFSLTAKPAAGRHTPWKAISISKTIRAVLFHKSSKVCNQTPSG